MTPRITSSENQGENEWHSPSEKGVERGSWKGLSDLADPKYLRRIWVREISKHLSDQKFSSKNFVVDPLQGAVVARNIDDFIGQLSRDLKSGAYAPSRGVILRSAKNLGVSRPVCVLQPRDALVYRALVKLAESELLRGVPSWVAFQRIDKASGAAGDDAESIDWFERWMRHEGMLPNLLERDDIQYVVQSDVSNFFPSVRLNVVREHLANNTSLDRTLVRLCCQVIAAVHPRVAYADDSFLGLPQEAQNASRVIAQALLKPVDEEFAALGADGRYSRFMDDVIWGVSSIEEAHRILSRFQNSLETIGLYPNGSKTRVRTKADFVDAYMVSSNAALSDFDERIEPLFKHGKRVAAVDPAITQELQSLSSAHKAMVPRPDRWSRVTRRLYTLHRRLGLIDWAHEWADDLAADPSGAATYFEYFRSWPLTNAGLIAVGEAVDRFFGLYIDIEIMFAESVATAPVSNDPTLWTEIAEFATSRFALHAKMPNGDANIASAWFACAFKYANKLQRGTIVDSAIKWCAYSMPTVVIQATAIEPSIELSTVVPPARYGPDEALAADFFRRLDEADPRTVNVVRSQLAPVAVLAPLRNMVRPRSLQLLDRAGKVRALEAKQVQGWLARLTLNEDRLRDFRTENLLAEWV